MHGVKLVGSRRLLFKELFAFDPNDFVMVDIVNDGSAASQNRGFIADPGFFVYDASVSFDALQIQSERIRAIRMEIFLSPPNVLRPVRSASQSRASNFKCGQQELVNELNRQRIKPLIVREFDLGVELPNDAVQSTEVERERLRASLLSRTEVLLNEPLQTRTRELPHSMTARLASNAITQAGSNQSAAATRRSNLRINALDPAKIGQSYSPALPTLQGMRGNNAGQKAPHYDPYDRKASKLVPVNIAGLETRVSLQTLRRRLLESIEVEAMRNSNLMFSQTADRADASAIISNAPNETVELANQVFVESSIRSKNFRLEIDKKLIGNRRSIFVRLTPVLSRLQSGTNAIVIPATFEIQHAEQLKRIGTPRVPPRMERIRTNGSKVSFRVTQMDPVASKVIILKRIVTPDPFDEEPSQVFAQFDLGYRRTSIIINDDNARNWAPNQVVYTAMSQYEGQDGPFDSLVYDGQPCPFAPTQDQNEGTTRLSIVATNAREGIAIRIGRISENVKMISLYREQINGQGSKRDRTIIIKNDKGQESTRINGSSEGLEFFDSNTRINAQYRYYCVMTLRGGTRSESNDDEIVVRRKTRDALPLDVNVQQPILNIDRNGNIAVSINLQVQQKSSTFQYVKELLGEQAANVEFLDEIRNNRDELNDIMIFHVERIDLKTGKRASLGFHKSGEFVDNEFLSLKFLAPAIRPGRRYMYSFIACLVPPSTFLSGVFNRLSTGNILGIKDIEYLANKFDNYVIRNFGILPSNAQLTAKLDAEQLIMIGNTGVSFVTEIETPTPLDVLRNVDLDDSPTGTKISWSLSRTVNDLVDYCNIYVTVNGNKELVGSVRNSGISSSLYFIDDRYHLSIGRRFYTIVAVFYDGTNSVELQSTTLERLSNVSPNALRNLLLNGTVIGVDAPTGFNFNTPLPARSVNLNNRNLNVTRPTLQIDEIINIIDSNIGINAARTNSIVNSPVIPLSQFNSVAPTLSQTQVVRQSNFQILNSVEQLPIDKL
jgi:hypothetical protein